MRYLCKLTIPESAPGSGWRDELLVPLSADGVKLAEWWKNASEQARVAVIVKSDEGNLIEAWKKVAAEILEVPSEKSEHDSKSTAARSAQANDDMGDPSDMAQPPVTNTNVK